jgi:hypothetical protein
MSIAEIYLGKVHVHPDFFFQLDTVGILMKERKKEERKYKLSQR